MYMAGDIFIMLEFLFYIIFVPFGGGVCFLLDYWNFMATNCAVHYLLTFSFSHKRMNFGQYDQQQSQDTSLVI